MMHNIQTEGVPDEEKVINEVLGSLSSYWLYLLYC